MNAKTSADVKTAQAVHMPWKLDVRKPGNEQLLTITCGGTWIATFHADNETTAFQAHPSRRAAMEYAEQAIRAVNSHAELIEACKALIVQIERYTNAPATDQTQCHTDADTLSAIVTAKFVLAKAEVQS